MPETERFDHEQCPPWKKISILKERSNYYPTYEKSLARRNETKFKKNTLWERGSTEHKKACGISTTLWSQRWNCDWVNAIIIKPSTNFGRPNLTMLRCLPNPITILCYNLHPTTPYCNLNPTTLHYNLHPTTAMINPLTLNVQKILPWI